MPDTKSAGKRYRLIDQMLTNKYRKYPSLQDIADNCLEEFGEIISLSSIEKDISAMRKDIDLGYFAPIKYNRTYKGYYYSDPEYTIQGIPLNDNDKLALRYAAAILKQFKKDALVSYFEDTIDKINDFVNFGLEPKQKLQFEYQPYVKGRELIPEILNAIENRLILSFDYQSGHALEKGIKKREVLPYLLKEYRNRWYMLSYHIEKKDVRTWALDRIQNLKIGKRFKDILPEFDHDSYFKYSFGITKYNDGKPELHKYSFDTSQKHYLLAQPLHHSQEILIDNAYEFRISIYVYPCEELERTIRSYGDLVRKI